MIKGLMTAVLSAVLIAMVPSAHAELISQGSYSSPASSDSWDDEQPITLNNATLKAKYGSSATSNSSFEFDGTVSNLGSWLTHRPLLNARATSGWGTRTLLGTTRHHSGVDLAAPTGTPIYAGGAGLVTKSGWGSGYGNYVEIDHGNGYITRYGHASRLNVSVGDRVNGGQLIAYVGCTGRCTGAHLHFEIVKAGQRQNPTPYLAMLP